MRNQTTCLPPRPRLPILPPKSWPSWAVIRRCWPRRSHWVTCSAQASRKQLLDCATRLGLNEVSKLSTRRPGRAHPGRVRRAGRRPAPTRCRRARAERRRSFPQKFDLGPGHEAAAMPQDIPWGYGHDRVTGMVVDPDRLYVYWEVTDDAIAAARAGLGAERRQRLAEPARLRHHRPPVRRHQRAQLLRPPRRAPRTAVVLRHQQADVHRVRRDRPQVGRRVTSSRSSRSGRVDFPRREPVGGGPVEWLSVRGASGPVGSAFAGAPAERRRGARRRRAAAVRRRRARAAPVAAAPRTRERVAGLDAVRRLPGPGRPAAVRTALDAARRHHRAVDQRVDAHRVGRARCCAASGKRARSPTRSKSPRAASSTRTTARSPSAPRAGARTSCTARGRWSSAASARAPSGACWDVGVRRQVAVTGGVERTFESGRRLRRSAAPSG